jgi:DNA-3-methyladenine glycosylase
MGRLPRSFFRRTADVVACDLIGQRLVRIVDGQRLAGVIVETEAYLGAIDKAAHSFGHRRTARNEPMYADGGTWYVYLNYGIHEMLNVVTESVEVPSAVLIRAVEPIEGMELMFARRPKARREVDLCSGPGKLGAAFGIDRSLSGRDLMTEPTLFIERSAAKHPPRIEVGPRVGVDYAEEWAARPLRFFRAGCPFVSRRR